MPLILYHTKLCRYTPAIRRVAEHLRATCEFQCILAAELARLPGAVYRESPVLSDDGKIIEDWRMIVRYLDERHGGKLTILPPAVQEELFALCQEMERALFLGGDGASRSPLRAVLQWIGVSRVSKVLPDAEALAARARAFEEDARLQRSEFMLARLLLAAATESISTKKAQAA